MSRETKDLSLFEQMGGTYFEKDGLLYPIFLTKQDVEQIEVGKYGLLWISFMKENYPDRYRVVRQIRCTGSMQIRCT